MQRKFIIDNHEVCIPEENIKTFYKIIDDCYCNHDEVLSKYDSDLFISEDGKVIDCMDCTKVLPEKLHNDEGYVIEVHHDFFTLDSAEGFIYKNKLYLTNMLEEVH